MRDSLVRLRVERWDCVLCDHAMRPGEGEIPSRPTEGLEGSVTASSPSSSRRMTNRAKMAWYSRSSRSFSSGVYRGVEAPESNNEDLPRVTGVGVDARMEDRKGSLFVREEEVSMPLEEAVSMLLKVEVEVEEEEGSSGEGGGMPSSE